jgi:hypothetical protein
MIKLVVVLVALAAAPYPAIAQQAPPSADSLVAYWLRRGALANWTPAQLLTGCPNLAAWQKRGIDMLLTAELSRERTKDLVMSWGIALEGCRDERVEAWLFRQVNAAMERGEHPWSMMAYWGALSRADSPGVRAYLRTLMLDTAKAEAYRDEAASALFTRFAPEERLREYLAAFETRRMPFEMQVGQTTLLLQQQPERLLRELGTRLRENPDLAEQGAFTLVVESVHRYASPSSRRQFAAAIQEGLRRHPKSGRQLERLLASIEHLQRP